MKTEKNYACLCKLGIDVKTSMWSFKALASSNLRRNNLKKKFYVRANSTLEIRYAESQISFVFS